MQGLVSGQRPLGTGNAISLHTNLPGRQSPGRNQRTSSAARYSPDASRMPRKGMLNQ